MKKKFISVVALGLAVGMTFGAVGCTEKEPEYNEADFSTAKTEDQIYQSILYGVEQYGDYTGALTLEMTSKSGGSEGADYSNDYTYTTKLSYDPTAKVMYMQVDNVRTRVRPSETPGGEAVAQTATSTMTYKIFKDGEQNYMYSSSSEKEYGATEATTNSSYYKVTQAYVDSGISSILSEYLEEDDMMEYLTAVDFATLKSAYETVYSAQLETQKTKDANAKATATVTATNTNGTLEAKIVTSTETTDEIEDGISGLIKCDSEEKMIGKDGKITELYTNNSVSATATVEGETVTMSESESYSIKLGYAFDQEGFDAITTTLPATVEDFPESSMPSYVEVKLNATVGDWSMEFDRSRSSTDTAENTFNSTVGDYFRSNADAFSTAWYTDSACTTAVDWTDKKAADVNGMNVYGKVTVNEGYAVVLTAYDYADKRSDAYKIVFGDVSGYEYLSGVSAYPVDSTNAENNKINFYEGISDSTVIYVNGVAQDKTATGFTYENKKFYAVSYCTEYTDTHSRFNIFKAY